MQKNKRVTIKSIADELELSPSTISYVLHGNAKEKGIPVKTINKVKQTAKQLGYIPNYWARSLKRQRTKVITTLIGSLGMNWANYLMLGVNAVLRENDYTSFLAVDWCDNSILKQEIHAILERNDEGVICQASPSTDSDDIEEFYSLLMNAAPPVVFVGNILETWKDISNFNTVLWNEKPAIKSAIEYLASTGCKKIAFIGSHHGVMSDISRFEAYKSAIEELGLEFREEWICWANMNPLTSEQYTKSVVDIGKDMSGNFWKFYLDPMFSDSHDRPDAILAMNDDIGMRLWESLYKMDISVPDEVSIVGIGNLFSYEMYLTTLVEPVQEMGKLAAETILEIIKNPAMPAQQKYVECDQLKVRHTTRKI